MDPYETNPSGQDAGQNEAVNRPGKASPFADSPYEVNRPQASSDQPQWQAYNPSPNQEKGGSSQDSSGVSGDYTAAPQPHKKEKGGKGWRRALAACLILLLVAASCGITAVTVNDIWESRNDETEHLLEQMEHKIEDLEEQIEDNSFTGNGNSISGTPPAVTGLTPGQVYAQNKKSVVAISNQVTTNIFGQVTERASSGSGFILSPDGYILTNHHVVEGAAEGAKLTVITYDGTKYPAKFLGSEPDNDVALIKIEATGLPAVKVGSSDDLIVGDQVVAIGNPMGELTNTLTAGYISAKERDVATESSIINMLQTDAAINPGNSGGPLFNMKGEVIGITTAKYSGTTSSGATIEGIGFAIPIDDVKDMIPQLKENGHVSKPYMGVGVRDFGNGMGVTVETVEPGGAADKAGVRVGDIVVGLGEYEVKSMADLKRALRDCKVGDTETLYIFRNRKVLELPITLAEKANSPAAETVPTADSMPQNGSARQWYEYWSPRFENAG